MWCDVTRCAVVWSGYLMVWWLVVWCFCGAVVLLRLAVIVVLLLAVLVLVVVVVLVVR